MRAALLLLLLASALASASSSSAAAAGAGDPTGSAAGAALGSPKQLSRVHANDGANGSPGSTGRDTGESTSSPYVDTRDQALWLDRYNWLRGDGLVWPAAGMGRLAWDSALAAEAHTAIQICSSLPQDAPGFHVFVDATPGRSLDASLVEDAIRAWGLNELFRVIPELEIPVNEGDAVGKGVYSRYSQLVWANTTRVGCAYAVCAQGRLAACKYFPVGNSPGHGWYEFGRPCSRCGGSSEPQTCFDNFCVGTSASGSGVSSTATLPAHEAASTVYQKHKVRSLQLALDAIAKRYRSGGAANAVSALSAGANSSLSSLCNNSTNAMVIQEQLSLLNLDGGLSPVAVVFGLFLGVSVILVMIVCIMHTTKPKKKKNDDEQRQEHEHDADQDRDTDDEPVHVI
ncbi:hypothetical protein PybrP1_005376 [[Pythium] brassicae (nom. inval.)]|nr:hypothetical protein PybrP1_005376 [[Pythium] brassicae (nom. inval.)]